MSHQSLSPFSEKPEVPSPICMGFTRLFDLDTKIRSQIPLSYQSFSPFSEKHEVPSPKCIGAGLFDLNTKILSQIPLSHQSFSPFSEKREVPSPRCIGSTGLFGWNAYIRSINRYTLTIFREQIIISTPFRNSIPAVNEKLHYYCCSTIERKND